MVLKPEDKLKGATTNEFLRNGTENVCFLHYLKSIEKSKFLFERIMKKFEQLVYKNRYAQIYTKTNGFDKILLMDCGFFPVEKSQIDDKTLEKLNPKGSEIILHKRTWFFKWDRVFPIKYPNNLVMSKFGKYFEIAIKVILTDFYYKQ